MSSRPLHPVLLTIGLHKDEAKNMKLPRGCKHPSKLFGFPCRTQWNAAQTSLGAADGMGSISASASPLSTCPCQLRMDIGDEGLILAHVCEK